MAVGDLMLMDWTKAPLTPPERCCFSKELVQCSDIQLLYVWMNSPLNKKYLLENVGIDPTTSHMLSERSTI